MFFPFAVDIVSHRYTYIHTIDIHLYTHNTANVKEAEKVLVEVADTYISTFYIPTANRLYGNSPESVVTRLCTVAFLIKELIISLNPRLQEDFNYTNEEIEKLLVECCVDFSSSSREKLFWFLNVMDDPDSSCHSSEFF